MCHVDIHRQQDLSARQVSIRRIVRCSQLLLGQAVDHSGAVLERIAQELYDGGFVRKRWQIGRIGILQSSAELVVCGSPTLIDSGCGRNPYFSAGMASATAIDSWLRAARCLEYSAAGVEAGAACETPQKSEIANVATAPTETAKRCIIRPLGGNFSPCTASAGAPPSVLPGI
jgi:hypothetical protein